MIWKALGIVVGIILLIVIGGFTLVSISVNNYYAHAGSIESTMGDRYHWGIAAFSSDTGWYANPHVCTAPLTSTACMRTNRPACRSHAWLASHGRWPLTWVGNVVLFGHTYTVNRPSRPGKPPALYVAYGGCHLEYLPTTAP